MAKKAAKTTLGPKVNQLIDKLESGKLSMREFVRQVTRLGIPKSGVGALVEAPEAQSTLTKDLLRTGVLVKIDEDKAAEKTVVHGTMRPGAVEFSQLVRSAPWTLESKAQTMEVVRTRTGARETVPKDTLVEVKKGQPIQFSNPGKRSLEFVMHQPIWEPKDYAYQYDGRRIAGEEMWFELKTSTGDKKQRPMYNVISAGGKGNYVLVTVEPKSATLRCFYTDGDYVVTGVTGVGAVEIEAKGKTRTVNLSRGANAKIAKKETFSVVNQGADTLVVEIRSLSARYWAPESSYFDVGKTKFVSGSEIYFEFVIPT
jgi:hypothetical protein